jgi:anti-anti-sigma factor
MKANISLQVRPITSGTSVIDISGEINSFAESALMDAYSEATTNGAKNLLLNFNGLEYMNSSGIGLLVTLLVRAQRQKQKLAAFGLNNHYKQIFDLTRLNEVILIFDGEEQALKALGA